MTAFVDTNILVRHLTGDPPDMAAQATAYLGSSSELLLTDLVVAETMYVLESFYKAPREVIAEAMRSLIAFGPIITVDPALLATRHRGLRNRSAGLCRRLLGGQRRDHWR